MQKVDHVQTLAIKFKLAFNDVALDPLTSDNNQRTKWYDLFSFD